jgi:hypothetical protein
LRMILGDLIFWYGSEGRERAIDGCFDGSIQLSVRADSSCCRKTAG